MELTPMWRDDGDGSHRFGIDSGAGWNGVHNQTQGIGHGGQLSLAPLSTLATLADFETLVETLPDWEGQGLHHGAWIVQSLNGTPSNANAPSNATDGQRVLATQGYGGLDANMSGCLASPNIPVPAFVSRFNLSFDHWLSLEDDDAAWVEWRASGGSWQQLNPSTPYTNASTPLGAPSTSWAGQSAGWDHASFGLDALLPSGSTDVEVRFCFSTSTSNASRNGWYIDNFTVSNQGDVPGAWFHGNMSGDYANNANGRLYLRSNLSGFSGPLELEFWADWDLEGAFADNLLVSFSVDNGTRWQTVSGIPGLPGNGYTSQGTFYMDESLGWQLIRYNLPGALSSHVNSSSVLFEFHVQTNYQTGYGGFASSGWEGIAIDDVAVHHRRGTAQAERIMLANFSSSPSGAAEDSNGWLEVSPTSINEWNYTTDFGMNPPTTTTNSFERSIAAPAGWVIEGTWPDGWELGETRNSSGWGPGLFHSGANGAAINLTTKYTNNVYTHLVTQEYTIPNNATARLSFRSWVCTEPNWDGGGVSVSTDGGQSWWWLPYSAGFHDQISTANTNSPFFGRGIIDGSSQPNGCNTGKGRPFELKTYDLSNLSGQSIKARYSFFSDTFVEADGWYIDDAGIEIDVFESSGDWLSPSLTPDPLFGYGWLDGWYEQPDGTTLNIDVLDRFQQPIAGHSNLTLPAALALDPMEHPSIQVRVRMTTNDTFVTPLIHSMTVGRTVFVGPSHIMAYSDGANVSTINSDGDLVVSSPFSIPLPSASNCPHDGYRLTTYGDNLTWQTPLGQLTSSAFIPHPEKKTYLNHSLGGAIEIMTPFTISASGGEVFERAKAEFDCARPTESPLFELGWNNATLFDWPPAGMSQTFGLNTQWTNLSTSVSSLEWNGSQPKPTVAMDNTTMTVSYNSVQPMNPQQSGTGAGLTMLVSNQSAGAELTFAGTTYALNGGEHILWFKSVNGCGQATVLASLSTNFSLSSCLMDFTLSGSADVKVLNFMHLQSTKAIEIGISADMLNSAKSASATGDFRAVLDIPLHISTSVGGVRVGLQAATLPLMNDHIDPPQHLRWLPDETVSFRTHHDRSDPLNGVVDSPDITAVDLYLSRTASMDDGFVHVQLDRIQDTPRFRQMKGAGLAFLDPSASEVTCSVNACSVLWTLTSTWLLDDIDDLHILTQAMDDDGMQVGPEVYVSQTPFNEIENDLEIIDFTVVDATSRRLDDWTNSFWPYHLNENTSMTAQGRVRIEGIAQEWAEAGDAEAQVTLTAVPPKNLSGGPDEWPGEPVNWSMSWTVEVGSGGWFSTPLLSPNATSSVPSNTWLELRPSLSRSGPSHLNASTSEDRTVVLTPTRFLHDTHAPRVESLMLLDSGDEVLADQHVSMYGRDIALRLQLSDPEGLNSLLEVWTWLEARDDANENGVMEEEEYRFETVSLNRGVLELEVDLPLLSSLNVVPESAFEGRLSVVLKGEDLAGNPLLGGGDFGEASDAATIRVQRRADTTVGLDDFTLDTVQGHLLAGHLHQFSMSLSDGNGLESLERLELALLGENNDGVCFIHFEPRFGAIDYDEACFIEPPTVSGIPRGLTTTYDLTFAFRMDWNMSQTNASEGGAPSLKVFDEGQDLGLGLYQLSAQQWTPSTVLDMRWLTIEDTMKPYGDHNETTRWFHRNDVVHHQIGVFHANTSVLARDLPQNGTFSWELTDGERRQTGMVDLTSSGRMMVNVTMDENVMYNDTGHFRIEPNAYAVYGLQALVYSVVVDDRAPKLVLSPGTLENLASNALTVNLTISVNDDTDMPPEGLEMHSVFYRMGQPVEGTQRIDVLSLSEVVNAFFVYNGTVNFQPESVELTRSDVLIVWFNATDRSGRTLTGLGTEAAPLSVGLTWVAVEPVFTDLSALPYRPQVGDNITVYARVANSGLMSGEMIVLLRDDGGKILGNESMYLESGEWINLAWNIEAWKIGRLGLTVEIVDYTPRVPIPLADIQDSQTDGQGSSMATISLSILALVVAGMVLFTVRQQRAQREERYHIERIRRIVSHRRPPPVPWELVETPQEE